MSYNRQSWSQNIVLTSQATNAAYIVSSASYRGGILPINGPGAGSDGNYVNKNPAFVTITAAADESLNTFSITGKDQGGRIYSVSIAGPDTSSITIEIPFQIILADGITMANDSSGAVSVGILSETSTPWIPFYLDSTPLNSGINVTLSSGATLTYTVEYTQDFIYGPSVPVNIQSDQFLVNETASGSTPIPYATGASRLRISSWTNGSARMQVTMAGANTYKNF